MNVNHWQVRLCYAHFVQRLEERFGIEITLEEYAILCRTPATTIKNLTKHSRLIEIEIKGIKIRAVKETTRNRCLKTVFKTTN